MARGATRTDTALLLRRHRYGESSLVVHALTRGHGRVTLLAKGAYRPKSRYCGALDLFDTLELSWSTSARSELLGLREARPVVLRRPLSASLARYRSALSALELADLAARPGQPEASLFRVLERFLDRLARGAPPLTTLVAFELHFLDALGLFPALESCASCGGEPETTRAGRATFSAGAGGRLCPGCAAEARASGRRVGTLPVEVLRLAGVLTGASDEILSSAPLTTEVVERVRDFADRFVEYHLEVRPRSWRRRPARRAAVPSPR